MGQFCVIVLLFFLVAEERIDGVVRALHADQHFVVCVVLLDALLKETVEDVPKCFNLIDAFHLGHAVFVLDFRGPPATHDIFDFRATEGTASGFGGAVGAARSQDSAFRCHSSRVKVAWLRCFPGVNILRRVSLRDEGLGVADLLRELRDGLGHTDLQPSLKDGREDDKQEQRAAKQAQEKDPEATSNLRVQLLIHRVLEVAGLTDHHFHDEGRVVIRVLFQVVHGRLQQHHKLVHSLLVFLLSRLATIRPTSITIFITVAIFWNYVVATVVLKIVHYVLAFSVTIIIPNIVELDQPRSVAQVQGFLILLQPNVMLGFVHGVFSE